MLRKCNLLSFLSYVPFPLMTCTNEKFEQSLLRIPFILVRRWVGGHDWETSKSYQGFIFIYFLPNVHFFLVVYNCNMYGIPLHSKSDN